MIYLLTLVALFAYLPYLPYRTYFTHLAYSLSLPNTELHCLPDLPCLAKRSLRTVHSIWVAVVVLLHAISSLVMQV